MKFSVIVVSLNPGAKLEQTLNSILRQTCGDYEVIIKDGGSSDGSVDRWKEQAEAEESQVRFIQISDKGIYDAMNQAVSYAKGDFILFLNCGDLFADEKVLERTAAVIEGLEADDGSSDQKGIVLYGDTLGEKNGVVIASPPQITGFSCYRNIPCHQSCFYSAGLCREKPYDSRYKIRADYDHFLWCFYCAGASMEYLGFSVSRYEGGGYSESKENRKRDRREHREITKHYMSRGELFRYRLIMAVTLAPLRRILAENSTFSGLYHKVKEIIYKR